MKQSLRSNLFLKTIYGEASESKKELTKALIAKDWGLREEYVELHEAVKSLPRLKLSPSSNVLQSILRRSALRPAGSCC